MDRIRQDKLDLADVDRKLFQIFSEQIFNTGFVHADPHPGNGTLINRLMHSKRTGIRFNLYHFHGWFIFYMAFL